MTLKVLHVTASDRFAGVEAHVRSLAGAQADAGFEVTVAGGDPARMRPVLDAHGVRFVRASTALDVARVVRRSDADVIHSHLTSADFGAYLGTRLSHTPVVATRHTPQLRGATRARRIALRHSVSGAIAAETAVSTYAAAFVDGPCTVIHAGVPPEDFVPMEQRDPVLLIAQRMEPEKATADAVDIAAWSGLLDAGWCLRVAGDGTLRPRLEAQVAALGIADHTEFLGRLPEVRTLMRSAGVLLAPCRSEAYGLSVVEAMAGGLPVVASASGGHLETVGSVAPQLLFAPGDVVAGAKVLAELAGDGNARSEVGRRLHETQQRDFTVQRQLDDTLRVYRSVL